MKIFIASDIHGSAKYCKILLDAYKREGAERMLLLGDILYHGPRNDLPEEYAPKKVIEMLNSIKDEIYAVRGNCEAEVDQMVLGFPVLADYALIPLGEKMIFATHGHVYNRDDLPPMKNGDILLHGHTHIPSCERFDGYIYMNPGSVSLPKNGTHRGYMILEESCRGEKDPGTMVPEGSGMFPSRDLGKETAVVAPQPMRGLWTIRWKTLEGEEYMAFEA